jgi:glycosyltransferase involved in cell wall biosynthesis
MHISYLTTEYPHHKLPPAGGIGSFIHGIATELIKQGHQVTIFLILREEEKLWYDGKIRIIEVKDKNYFILKSIFYRNYLSKLIKKYIGKLNLDLIEGPDWEGWHALLKTEIPIVTRLHGSMSYFNNLERKKNSLLISYFEKIVLKNSKIVAVSDFAGRHTECVFRFNEFKFTTIYNGVDVNRFRLELEHEKSNNHRILYFGTLARKKGVLEIPFILNALYKINPIFEFVLLGKDSKDSLTGKSTWELFKLSCDNQVLKNVKYEGVLSHAAMANQIAIVEICIFPSFAEAFPISWLEAMAMRKAVVASNIGWAPEMIDNGVNGILVDPKNHQLFASSLNHLLINKDVRTELGNMARIKIEKDFNNCKLIDENILFYKTLLKNEK